MWCIKSSRKTKKKTFFFLFKVKSCLRASTPLSGAFVLFGSGLFQEKAITPGESLSLAGTDWLIGNHSDELTPWIPVMAARRVISMLNLTQPLECQLMSLKGDYHYRACERMCEACQYVTSLVGLLGAMLSLRVRILVYWTMSILLKWLKNSKFSTVMSQFAFSLTFFCSGCRSSYSCRYFVLPCCFFDFYEKYQRRQCKKSQYKEYIDFITEVSKTSGFNTEEDCLRIPSTKRVGAGRYGSQLDFNPL